MKAHLALYILAATIVPTSLTLCQPRDHAYTKQLYPDSAFILTSTTYHLRDLAISIRQVKTNDIGKTFFKETNDFYDFSCRVWFTITRHGKTTFRKFLQCDPVDSPYGLFVPQSQPSPNFFTVVMMEGYNGILYLVDTLGRVSQYLGGSYAVSSDRKLLFSRYHSDGTGFEVVDLMNGKSILRQFGGPYQSQWYESQGRYFFVDESIPDSLYALHIRNARVTSLKTDSVSIARMKPIPWWIDPQIKNSCGCSN